MEYIIVHCFVVLTVTWLLTALFHICQCLNLSHLSVEVYLWLTFHCTQQGENLIKFNKKCLQINLILRTVWALSKDWNNDVCTLDWLTCRSRGKKTLWCSALKTMYSSNQGQAECLASSLPVCFATYTAVNDWLTAAHGLAAVGILWACWIIRARKRKLFHLVLEACLVLWNDIKRDWQTADLYSCHVKSRVPILSVGNVAWFIQTVRAESWRGEEWAKEWPRTLNFWHHCNDWFGSFSLCKYTVFRDPGCHSCVKSGDIMD